MLSCHVCAEHADPDDPLRVTDDTRFLGLIVSVACAACYIRYCCGGSGCMTFGVIQDSRAVLQVCRGTAVMLVAPSGGMEEIANPFMEQG